MRMNQVTLPARDIERAKQFYRDLGFLQIVDSPHYARFECEDGGATFSLLQTEEDFRNGSTIYFEIEDLDTRVEELVEKGIQFDQLPEDMRYLWREAILRDPSGNKIKLYCAGENRLRPPWRVELRS